MIISIYRWKYEFYSSKSVYYFSRFKYKSQNLYPTLENFHYHTNSNCNHQCEKYAKFHRNLSNSSLEIRISFKIPSQTWEVCLNWIPFNSDVISNTGPKSARIFGYSLVYLIWLLTGIWIWFMIFLLTDWLFSLDLVFAMILILPYPQLYSQFSTTILINS